MFLSTYLLICLCSSFVGSTVVTTNSGTLRGVVITTSDGPVHQFRKVPYANPPVGSRRFQRPVPVSKWNGTLDATTFGPSCIQYITPELEYILPNPVVSEDCLFLNIYVPRDMTDTTKKSVMVFVHGGGFETGQGMLYDGTSLALHGDVIVVTLNYRLGVFGFLSTNDSIARGNYGLWDQIQALKWIKSNIQYFGGNPDSITIFGKLEGAMSVFLLSILPINKGLFHRVIMQSAFINSFGGFLSDPLISTHAFGRYLNCSDVIESSSLVSCLKNINALTLRNAANVIHNGTNRFGFKSNFQPVIDGDLIPQHPMILLQNASSANLAFYQSLDVISGCTSADGYTILLDLLDIPDIYDFNISEGVPSKVFKEFYVQKVIASYFQNNTRIMQPILSRYASIDIAEQRNQLINFFSDLMFYKPMMEALFFHKDRRQSNSKTFQFILSKTPWTDFAFSELSEWFTGAGQVAELGYLFDIQDYYYRDDNALAENMRSYWTNFAKNGDPNTGQDVPSWPEFEHSIDLNINITTRTDFLKKRMNLWLIQVPRIMEAEEVTINTTLGLIKGISFRYGNQKIIQYRKVPFAHPPTGDLRFQKPISPSSWQGILDATSFGPSCMQLLSPGVEYTLPNHEVSEDCLYLNIYVPNEISIETQNKSVMVYIHGGAYEFGQGMVHDGTLLALQGDVIVVTINYRLGVFGFLSTGDSSARGNYGLWDQIEALKWIKSNIQLFGGNPDSITIFGESAGAFSVSLLSILPINRGLFHRVIMQSGSLNSFGGIVTDPLSKAQELGKALNCNNLTDTQLLAECLRNIDPLSLTVNAVAVYFSPDNFFLKLAYQPVIDGDLIENHPTLLLQNATSENLAFYQSLDVISGCTSYEGSLFLTFAPFFEQVYGFNISDGLPSEILKEIVAPKIVEIHFQNMTEILPTIVDQYTSNDMVEQGRNILNVIGDIYFYKPMIDSLLAHSSGRTSNRKSFQYLFSRYQPYVPIFGESPAWFDGAGHEAELSYIFEDGDTLPGDDLELSQEMQSFWTNFAKNGDPNVGQTVSFWPEYEMINQQYIDLDTNRSIDRYLYQERMKFWSTEIPEMIDNLYVTVETNLGSIRGLSLRKRNQTVSFFFKVPFANPPTGNLRFEKPTALSPWQGVLDATKFGPSCMQTIYPGNYLPNIDVSEDCLFLNIYVPNEITNLSRKSVMVFIHGGGYRIGQGMSVDGTSLALHGNVIVVTINYRLGVFGFLSTGDSSARGNYGLWDQIEALKWIKSNIQYFGGNPDSITIFGESAGAFSVSLLSILPVNKGLFHKVIMQSGSLNSLGGIVTNPLSKAIALANTVLCTNVKDTLEIVSCLRNADALTLKHAADSTFPLFGSYGIGLDILPVVDGDLISADPIILLQSLSSRDFYQSLDVISGCNSAEGSYVLLVIDSLQSMFGFNISEGVSTSVLKEIYAPKIVEFHFNNDTRILKPIIDKYKASDMAEQGRQLLNFIGDFVFYKPMMDVLLAHTNGRTFKNKSFQYLFTINQLIHSSYGQLPTWFEGAGHAFELDYVFGSDFLKEDDIRLSYIIKSFWTNFAKTGDPNNGLPVPNWPVFESTRNAYIRLDYNVTEEINLFSDRMTFWSEEIPKILSEDVSSGNRKYCSLYWLLVMMYWVLM